MPEQVELIAYADRLGCGLGGLRDVLDGPLAGLFGGVHVLPFFRPYDGADAGFDPADHTEVDQRLGSWADVQALAADHAIMVDVIVSHVSSSSPPFLDWLASGPASEFDGMFLTLDRLAAAGVTRVRLDAVGYAVKTQGTTRFMTPETFAFIDEITAWCHERSLAVLVEVHSY